MKFKCPKCGTILEGQPERCPTCGAKFNWKKVGGGETKISKF